MRLILNTLVCLLLFAACSSSTQKQSTHPELSDRKIPEGYKRFVPFNNGFEMFFPEDWRMVEKAKHEYVNFIGPKSQSSFDVKPTINVTMRRGSSRYSNGETKYIPYEFEKFCENYIKALELKLNGYELIELSKDTINGSTVQSLRIKHNDGQTNARLYEELVMVGLPYRMYTVRMACLNDELFRNKEHFEVVKASFLAKAREDGSF